MSGKPKNVDGNERITKNEEPNGESTCTIKFDNPNRVYYAGQSVTGCAKLTINKMKSVRSIYARVIGRGYCMWRVQKTANIKEQFYFNRKIYYVGSQNNASGRITIPPGVYNYLFDCVIPDESHTSVEEDTGFIRYSVTVVIEEDFDTKTEFVESFTVINPLNLNDDETHSYPMSDDAEFTFTKYCCLLCCWITEPVKFSVKVPMKGYAPGQAIEITINVDNKSNQTYDNFSGNIFKKIEFYANNRTSTSTEKIATFNCEGCPADRSLSRILIVTVPPTPRTETSTICSISYQLTVEAFADGCRDDLKLEFPLTIGSYPIQNTNTQTGRIVVTQQPVKALQNGQDVEGIQSHNDVSIRPLLREMSSSQQQPIGATCSNGEHNKIVSPEFRVGESSRSDKDLEKSYRPMYPTYTSSQYPLACILKVEAGEVKLIKT